MGKYKGSEWKGEFRWYGGGCDEMRDILHTATKLSSKGEFNFYKDDNT